MTDVTLAHRSSPNHQHNIIAPKDIHSFCYTLQLETQSLLATTTFTTTTMAHLLQANARLLPRSLLRASALRSATVTSTPFLRAYSSTKPSQPRETSAKSPYSFLPTNKLHNKQGILKRKDGMTEIRGSYYNPVTFTYLNELLTDWGGKCGMIFWSSICCSDSFDAQSSSMV